MNEVQKSIVKLFEDKQIRVIWQEESEEFFFCVNDVIVALTDSENPTNYLKQLRHRDSELSEGWLQIVTPLLVDTAGGPQKMNFATLAGVFRIIQSVPSKKAEPVKRWLAAVGAERINQMQDPERSIDQAVADYRKLGYSEQWINQRIKTIEIRKKLTDEWRRGGILSDADYAMLTDIISKTWSGLTTREYKRFKGLRKQSLRDNMTDVELMLNGLAEASSTAISKETNPEGLAENAAVAVKGATIAKNARHELEAELGHSVISSENAIGHITPEDELPLSLGNSLSDDSKETF